MNLPVITVGEAGADVAGGLERLHGPVTVVRRCSELTELMAACQSGLAVAAVIVDGSEELTTTLVDRLAAVGVSVVALTDDPVETRRLESIGVVAAGVGIDPSGLAVKIAEAVEGVGSNSKAAPRFGTGGFADPSAAADFEAMADAAEAEDEAGEPGEVIAVWGPIGSPGRTTVAVNMAAELAGAGKKVVLVDADSYGASMSAVLGLLEESAGLAQACRLADQGMLTTASFKAAAVEVFTPAGAFMLLSGTTRSDRWTELREGALTAVLEMARRSADVVVVDTGFCLEADEELSFDTLAPRRNISTLRSLEMADTVYAVGTADAIGLPRLVRGLAELEAAVPQASPKVVLNKLRRSAAGRSPRLQVEEAWNRFVPGAAIEAFLPGDDAVCDAALLSGSVLLESAPDSGLRRAIAGLVCAPEQQKRDSFRRSTRALHRQKR
ncbi:AAA family ATPase [Paenarthrobacter ilicis]|uniref:Mrp family chromosome partitioning ATPase n=1 Tax=Paenarthrobacter ilicis TaxID=43665 RepID=A0ABX0TBP1_9MICC|nr:Mrp family chromosome partitioning ATPase [Paenarthrobacter ilicis]NII99939.1 Mrp family chromosome partitioning ATPase [Paenarthrobacter ilicis]